MVEYLLNRSEAMGELSVRDVAVVPPRGEISPCITASLNVWNAPRLVGAEIGRYAGAFVSVGLDGVVEASLSQILEVKSRVPNSLVSIFAGSEIASGEVFRHEVTIGAHRRRCIEYPGSLGPTVLRLRWQCDCAADMDAPLAGGPAHRQTEVLIALAHGRLDQ